MNWGHFITIQKSKSKIQSKSRLIDHMTVFLRMIVIMLHRSTVDSPIASRPISNTGRQLSIDLISIEEDHLEPEFSPADIANGIFGADFNLARGNRRYFHDLSVHDVWEFILLHLFKHVIEDVFGCLFLAHQEVFNRLKFVLVWTKEAWIDFRFPFAILNELDFVSRSSARWVIEIAEVLGTENTELMKAFICPVRH